MRSVIVYGDISPNVIDGSSIWLMSVTEVLSNIFGRVDLQLKMKPTNDRLLSALENLENVNIHHPLDEKVLDAELAAVTLEGLVDTTGASAVVARGMDLCNQFVQSSKISPILWSYITDLPFPPEKISKNNINRLRRIANGSRKLFAQTEAARSYLESLVPEAAGKTLLMTPMVPDYVYEFRRRSGLTKVSQKPPLQLVYSGKFAREWKTLEMLELPRKLRDLGIAAELIVVGDKFNKSSTDPTWLSTMREQLTRASQTPESGVSWVGGKTREEALRIVAESDIGIGWRTAELESSLEISTKAIEYSAAGVPTLVNKSRDNFDFFGSEYPLYVDAFATVDDAAETIVRWLRSNLNRDDNKKYLDSSEFFAMSETVQRLKEYFDRDGIFREQRKATPTRLLIASHDMKFLGEVVSHFDGNPDYELKLDRWSSLREHDEAESKELAQWADVVFCEWAGPNLAWYSQNLDPSKKLITRLHGFEIRTGNWWDTVNLAAVDKWVFVSEHYRRKAVDKLGIDESTTSIVTNSIDAVDLNRPKLAGSQFQLGMIGYVPFLKRPDRALEVLDLLVKEDKRYVLRIKGRAPWEYPYEWKKPLERQAYMEFFHEITTRGLNDHIIFDEFGPDIGNWLRGVGIVLSPSDEESFHLAPAEGMISGSVPFIWEREGADNIFPSDSVGSDVKSISRDILALRDPTLFSQRSVQAKEYAERWDTPRVLNTWEKLIDDAVG